MPNPVFSHDQLCSLTETEPSPADAVKELYQEWKKAELEELWLELKRIEEIRLHRIQERRRYIERLTGVRLNVRVPKKLVTPPARIYELIEQS